MCAAVDGKKAKFLIDFIDSCFKFMMRWLSIARDIFHQINCLGLIQYQIGFGP